MTDNSQHYQQNTSLDKILLITEAISISFPVQYSTKCDKMQNDHIAFSEKETFCINLDKTIAERIFPWKLWFRERKCIKCSSVLVYVSACSMIERFQIPNICVRKFKSTHFPGDDSNYRSHYKQQ